ncbi:MAG: hypothetical protein C4B58_06955 [Deltaproteobacteria bacterium]|nr:MAG: hypothetical protein C4B58_06955 [Deltaproteobacteria bacterium]
MKKKPQNRDSILAKAEKFFNRENYPLAKREFEKANRIAVQDDITEKIKICVREIGQLKAKDLVKKARKYAKKSKLREALRCFEQAYGISGEDWIRERINQLKGDLSSSDSLKAARQAEASGEYEKAAGLYAGTQKGKDTRFKMAHCLVRAGRYDDAVSAFKDLTLSDYSAMYDYGFALAKVGKYHQCLNIWGSIESDDSAFLKQRASVRSLLASDLYDRFEHSEDFAGIYKEGISIVNSTGDGCIGDLVEYCKYAWIDQLWKEEQYETIRGLLLPFPTKMEADLLTLYAKTFFKLAEISGEHLSDLIMFWLTTVYHPEISWKFSARPEERDNVRRALIQKAEDLLKKYADVGDKSSKTALVCWNVEKKLVEDLQALVGDREDLSCLVCSPQFAVRFGKSRRIIQLIRDNRGFFTDLEHYLLTGGYYSSAGPSLFHLENRQYDKALAGLPVSGSYDTAESEFVGYCVERVQFACGLHCLEEGESLPGQYIETTVNLFNKTSKYEQELIDKAIDSHEPDKLRLYEDILNELHSMRPTKGIKDALSLVMSRRAIMMFNMRQMNSKVLNTTIRKALKLNPENEFASGLLGHVKVNVEIEKLNHALNRYKMGKACRIAAMSENEEVRDLFFEFMERNLEELDGHDMDSTGKAFFLRELYKWCADVDESHPILDKINNKSQVI